MSKNNTLEDFWTKADVKTFHECWNWLGGLTDSGYGRFRFNGKRYKTHRLAYELTYGPIPENKLVCHSCDNPKCCNPKHLFLGTPENNMKDMVLKGRSKRGEKHWNAKLTEKQIEEIRTLYPTGKYSYEKLGNMFEVSDTEIFRIIKKTRWYLMPWGNKYARRKKNSHNP